MTVMNSAVRTFSVAVATLLLTAACDGEVKSTEEAAATEAVEAASGAPAPAPAASEAPEGANGTYGDIVYGDPNAPVTVIEYASYTCGGCGRWAALIFPQLDEKYIQTGKVKFIFRNFIRDRVDLAAALTVRCKTPEVAKVLNHTFFERQAEWLQGRDVVNSIASIARRAGISRVDFDQCLADTDMRDHVVKMTQDGNDEYNIAATPTLIVNGEVVRTDWESLDEAISDAL